MENQKDINTVTTSPDDSGETCTNKLVETVKKRMNFILYSLRSGSEVDNDVLTDFVVNALEMPGWEILKPVNASSKGKAIGHPEYGVFASGRVDSIGDYIVDETGIPDSFSFRLKQGGNLVRLMGGKIRYTGGFKKS